VRETVVEVHARLFEHVFVAGRLLLCAFDFERILSPILRALVRWIKI